ncbi:ABC transporter permease [Sutterella sp.]|uniref:ABC transporter permease n=1 Tax=Sutterella sp. TaxID=1981025 RepID=UPI0026DEC7E7|nr:ABC transporter permease [Sutterella sp.]MDO5530807.1 ABC transporter permease [Sutterella sp.]
MLPVILPTDIVAWGLVVLIALAIRHVRRSEELSRRWRRVFDRPAAAASAAVLAVFLVTALMDSVHWREELPPAPGAAADAPAAYSPEVTSLLDVVVLKGLNAAGDERSYSRPFALREFDRTTVLVDGKPVRDYQPLKHAGKLPPWRSRAVELARLSLLAAIAGGVPAVFGWIGLGALVARRRRVSLPEGLKALANRDGSFPWRPAVMTLTVFWLLGVWLALVWPNWHVLGTDAVGNDVLYEAVKSIRTGIVIGTLATLATLPFALTLGIAAGYFRHRVDDVIQYIYTTISSIPSVLLIAASVLMIQVFLDKNPQWYQTSLERADLRLMLLAVIIGMTGWATLARLLRAETMKLSTLDFVTAVRALGVKPFTIMRRHILPNVMHIVLIVTVLDFSGIVLYEAVLSYVGVGVDPTMHSFGTMINAARSELSHSPMIWWNLAASFAFLLALVLSANLFASAVRDAFDPRAARSAPKSEKAVKDDDDGKKEEK